MKRYLVKLTMVSVLLICVILLIGICRALVINQHTWKLPENKHILFLGASHVMYAVDDSMMESAINLTCGGERYMYTYIKLHHLLDDNPQIDTVFLQFAPTDIWEDADSKYFEEHLQSGFLKFYWPYFHVEEWKVALKEPSQTAGIVFGSFFSPGELSSKGWRKQLGGYQYDTKTMDPEQVKPELTEKNGCRNTINLKYLHRIVDLCKKRKIKLFFIETPTYHPEFFYDQEFFYCLYQSSFSDIEFLDYSDWPMLDEERCDPHHLNHNGAVRFTKEIKERFHID